MMTSWDPAIERLLDHMMKIDASDLYITCGSPPVFRVDGVGHPGRVPLSAEQIGAMATSLMTPGQRDEFLQKHELNLALSLGEEGRFRVNVFQQRGAPGMVVRLVRTRIKSLADLNLPKTLSDVVMSKRGLVLLVGGTGSGKSTTLAAMIDHRNSNDAGHIITVEDPIEFVHPHKKSIVTQREVGFDTESYAAALKNTLRQAPDVILIGEIRDAETMEAAMAFAETGHLCLSTLHANNANQAIERILNFFPPARHHEIKLQLSLNVRAIISQRLLPTTSGRGRAAALEILLDTPRIRELVQRGEIEAIKDAMEQSAPEGCRTFDMALFELVAAGRVDEAAALKAADSANNLRLRIERWRASGGGPAEGKPNRPVLRLVPEPGEIPDAALEFDAPGMTMVQPAADLPEPTRTPVARVAVFSMRRGSIIDD